MTRGPVELSPPKQSLIISDKWSVEDSWSIRSWLRLIAGTRKPLVVLSMGVREISAFPWKQLPALRRDALSIEVRALGRLGQLIDLTQLPEIVSKSYALEYQGFGVERMTVSSEPLLPMGADVCLKADQVQIHASVEPALVGLVLSRLLDSPIRLDSNQPLAEHARGAWHAVAQDLCRRLAREEPLLLDYEPKAIATGLNADFWVRLEGQSFRGRVRIHASTVPARLAPSRSVLPVQLKLVVAQSQCTRNALRSLTVGDVFLPSDGSTIDHELSGSGILAAPGSQLGIAVELAGKTCTVNGPVNLQLEVAENGNDDSNKEQEVEEAMIDAPVVVHVEVGGVTMSAKEWLSLKPGDVITTGRRAMDPVVLRVAGQEVARGELVTVEGEVGVRIQSIAQTAS